MSRVCVPITASTCAQAAADIRAAADAGADLLELRLDFLDAPPDTATLRRLIGLARALACQVIATCRLLDEGGRCRLDEGQRLRLLGEAFRMGADYIDIEQRVWHAIPDPGKAFGLPARGGEVRFRQPWLILSHHDVRGTPADLDRIFASLAAEACDVIKVACQANTVLDALRMLDALRRWAPSRPTIALSMGEPGLITRVLARKLGAFLSFASLAAGKESAPGQIALSEMRSLYRWDAIGPDTQVYGVIGWPVAHSMSPAMMNAAFEQTGRDAVYLPLPIEPGYAALAAFLDACLARPWLGLCGCSVTIPHKENLLRYVREHSGEIEPLAGRIGVANTLCVEAAGDASTAPAEAENTPSETSDVRSQDPKLRAYNTDYRGALDALCKGIGRTPEQLGKLRIAVLGAGGAARAIVAGLRDCGAEVTIHNRTFERAQVLAAEFGGTALAWEQRTRLSADVVINCTSIGMWPKVNATPLPAETLRHRPAVFDTVYNPLETRLLREARQAGCRTVEGLGMLVNQAGRQFELWTGRPAPLEHMDRVARERLALR